MGKKILVQRKGRGGQQFRARDHLKVGRARYPDPVKLKGAAGGVIKEFLHEPARWTPLARIRLDSGDEFIYVPPEGVHLGKRIEIGPGASLEVGNILPLSEIPEGTSICNVELRKGDGGKVARRSGTFVTLFSRKGEEAVLRLPSGKSKTIKASSRATIGVGSGGGRTEKPLLKASSARHREKAHPKRWPKVRGVAMSSYAHPHGGGSHTRPGRPTTVSRTAPPGRKVGHIAARKTGRAKRKRGSKRRER